MWIHSEPRDHPDWLGTSFASCGKLIKFGFSPSWKKPETYGVEFEVLSNSVTGSLKRCYIEIRINQLNDLLQCSDLFQLRTSLLYPPLLSRLNSQSQTAIKLFIWRDYY